MGWRHNDVADPVIPFIDVSGRCGIPRSGYRSSIDCLDGGMLPPVHPQRRCVLIVLQVLVCFPDVESDHLCGTTIVYCKDVQVGN